MSVDELVAMPAPDAYEYADPTDAAWEARRRGFNLALDPRPAFVATPSGDEDVAAIVRRARDAGLRIAPQCSGHGATPLGALDKVVLLRTDALRGVEMNAPARQARVRAGTVWNDVSGLASDLGLAGLAGSSGTVGIVGYTLGGGLSWLGRRHGLACNSATAFELVAADGTRVRADADHEPELFWALRGGACPGVVTALEFELHPVPELSCGALFFDWARAEEVFHAWGAWTAGLPDELTSVVRILQFPPLPEVPEQFRGRAFAIVEVIHLGTADDLVEILAPLRALRPDLDTVTTTPPAALAGLHMDPPHPAPFASTHQMLDDFPVTAIDALLAVIGPGSGSPLVSVEVRHLGGALARPHPDHGALNSLTGGFCSFAVAITPDAASLEAAHAHLDAVHESLKPHDVGRYANFTDRPRRGDVFHDAATRRRLADVVDHWDPDGMFVANHPARSDC